VCKYCGITYYDFANRRNLYCSSRCSGHDRRGKSPSGPFNNKWKGGITRDVRAIRTSAEYIEWRKDVFKRDNYLCVKCGTKGYINAHHIIPFSKIFNEVKEKYPLLDIKETAKKFPKLWDVKNGKTLCNKCHKAEHFGTKGINELSI
jgi:hypothetical protein